MLHKRWFFFSLALALSSEASQLADLPQNTANTKRLLQSNVTSSTTPPPTTLAPTTTPEPTTIPPLTASPWRPPIDYWDGRYTPTTTSTSTSSTAPGDTTTPDPLQTDSNNQLPDGSYKFVTLAPAEPLTRPPATAAPSNPGSGGSENNDTTNSSSISDGTGGTTTSSSTTTSSITQQTNEGITLIVQPLHLETELSLPDTVSVSVAITNWITDAEFRRAYEQGVCMALRTRASLLGLNCASVRLSNIVETIPVTVGLPSTASSSRRALGGDLAGKRVLFESEHSSSRSLQSTASSVGNLRRPGTVRLSFNVYAQSLAAKSLFSAEMVKVPRAIFVSQLNLALTEAQMQQRLAITTAASFPVVTGLSASTAIVRTVSLNNATIMTPRPQLGANGSGGSRGSRRNGIGGALFTLSNLVGLLSGFVLMNAIQA